MTDEELKGVTISSSDWRSDLPEAIELGATIDFHLSEGIVVVTDPRGFSLRWFINAGEIKSFLVVAEQLKQAIEKEKWDE